MPGKYDRQVVVAFRFGYNDSVITTGAESLKGKWDRKNPVPVGTPSTSPTIHLRVDEGTGAVQFDGANQQQHLRTLLTGLTNQSRLYVCGHGNFEHQKVGQMLGEGMAAFLKDHGLRQVGMVSVNGCMAARGLGVPGDNSAIHLNQSVGSFGQLFHAALKDEHNGVSVQTQVGARVFEVNTLGFDPVNPDQEGRKATWRKDGEEKQADGTIKQIESLVGKQRESKVVFSWNEGAQQKQWAAYNDDKPEYSAGV